MGGRFAGTGDVDLGGWLSKGWEIIKDDIMTFAVASFLALLIALVTCGILGPAMNCGILMMVFSKMQGKSVQIGDVFKGTRRFVPAILTALLLLIPSLIINAISAGPQLIVQAAAPDNSGALLLTSGWNIVSSFILSALMYGAVFFVFPHIAARNVGPMEALQASWEIFRRNILMFAVVGFVYQLIVGLGVLGCCVGVFVTMPLVMAAQARAYIDHFGMQGVDPE